MVFDAKTMSMTLGGATILDATHPPIIKNRTIKANQGILARGLVLAESVDGDVPYDPSGQTPPPPIGILPVEVDTTKETVGPALRHGTVVWENVLVGSGAPDAADIKKLNTIGIY